MIKCAGRSGRAIQPDNTGVPSAQAQIRALDQLKQFPPSTFSSTYVMCRSSLLMGSDLALVLLVGCGNIAYLDADNMG
ncbi:hypothetical protein ACE6H2_015058 [Prunus campanulata]